MINSGLRKADRNAGEYYNRTDTNLITGEEDNEYF